ncbi:dipeptide ABC transporter ATP-binding protein [Lysinibacillus sp. FSL M8-0216]|uniref:Peptide/nickel transport system ATP-binding protein n=1 Tax=Lysinibacillus fusiformis TaxID=28031 RepID=A0A1H9HFW5_9BACI|nr:dipeptide ABC transporter ATP-binding protein [Lysinibacillus fusiformis]SCX55253.1 peptide/nickel transport system ATP-binding protein [Lysinibacillus fusiformis]SCY31205.1 peptide/nickel transport system ATP-binding protein [Lysinibacillus fusiformis]SDB29363.1 peptide/nickel transport system ATP-binding protein [Lysinibacillus fusiformis]SEN51736.1 peptide/nickel transport system ATP-binding protein [Lysinibacillus fusiformis]SEQ61178.1 peptide/nickel transport system ATP-binding protein
MPNSILKVENLKKSFQIAGGLFQKRQHVNAVIDVSFEIEEGTTFSLVGESGCGKSTTGRLITRLIEPSSGSIVVDGKEVATAKQSELKHLRQTVQMIFQDPYASLNPRMKVKELVGEPLEIHTKLSKAEREKLVLEMLEVVGLNADHADRYAHEFSGGQRQRLGIARALITKPKIIIADEPVSALDVSIQSQILNLLKQLQQEYKISYLFISHDLSVVEHISHYIGVMYLGTIVEIGKKEAIFNDPKHPYTQALIASVPIADPMLRKKKKVLIGDIPNPKNPPSGCTFHTRCPFAADICKQKIPEMKKINEEQSVACHFVN